MNYKKKKKGWEGGEAESGSVKRDDVWRRKKVAGRRTTAGKTHQREIKYAKEVNLGIFMLLDLKECFFAAECGSMRTKQIFLVFRRDGAGKVFATCRKVFSALRHLMHQSSFSFLLRHLLVTA